MNLKTPILLVALSFIAFAATAQNYNNIEFVENKGQWDPKVKYKAEFSSGAIFIRDGGFTILQHNAQDFERIMEVMHGHQPGPPTNETLILRSHAFNVDFENVSREMKVAADKMIPTYNNYFVGSDPAKWESNCRIFQALTMQDVYPNVDVRYYTNNGTLKYDIIVKPGADISRIALKYKGVNGLQVKNKELAITTSVGELRESSPYSYQTTSKGRQEVACKYVVKDGLVKFDVRGYDPRSILVIDPTMVYCSFTGSTADNWGYTATYGPDGSTYGGGIVFGNGFPITTGAFQTSFQGGNGSPPSEAPVDIGIIKLSPTGSNRIYATYIGGSGNELPHSLVVDNQGNVTLAGRTNSPLTGTGSYPVTGGAAGIIGNTTTMADWDIIVTKLNATGTGLVGSKRIGGAGMDGGNITPGNNGPNSLNRNYGDASRSEVIQDAGGNIYVASCTQSSDFPTIGSVFQPTLGGAQDGVVLKFNPTLSACLFSSYLGGSANDAAYVLALGPTGDLFVAGGTESPETSFPGNHAGTVGPVNNGGIDGFVAQISNNGSAIIRSTFIGTSSTDQVFGIQFDLSGYPYIMGQTTGTWQIRNAIYGNSNAKQFIAKLERNLSNYIYSTAFGPNSSIPNISPVAFLVDRCENVYVSGWGGSLAGYPSGGTSGMPITSDAYQSSTDGNDFYFFVLKKNAADILYGSYFGKAGGLPDHVDGGTSRFNQDGVIYQGICADCGSGSGTYPTTSNAWARVKPSTANCNMAMVKIEFNLAGVDGGIQSSINGVPRDSAGCIPLTVDFSDTIANAVSYEWYFNYVPGNPPDLTTTVPNASYTYTAVGLYTVMLVAIDPNTCNVRDSSFIRIRAGDLRATLAWQEIKLAPCEAFSYRFDNLSVAPAIRPFGPQSFVWDFGDGSPRVVTGAGPVFHNFPGQGTYNVTLLLQDTGYCNSPDSLTRPVSVAENVIADFSTDSIGCVPHPAVFDNESVAGQTFQWDFGDGNTSTASSPTHIYTAAGFYRVRLIAFNPNTCNGSDTAYFDIRVYDIPVADFSWGPNPPVENTPTTFNNNSSADAVSFHWDFGDGDTLFTTSRLPVQHQYNASGKFNACLVAYNAQGCPDTVCQEVSTLILPLIDVPNAFTPQSGDVNSVVMPRGYGISKIQFIIWNRWGQKVYETNSRNQGWDGKVKGVVQPMDVYAYTLYVEFFDGTKTTRKGDITLIR